MKNDEESLSHIGILGMRWGVRKGSSSSSSSGAKKKESTPSQDYERVSGIKKKKLSELSNDDIRALQTRMQLEKEYRNLSQTKIDKGKKVAMEILGTAGKQVATEMATKILKDQSEKMMKKMLENAAKSAAGG